MSSWPPPPDDPGQYPQGPQPPSAPPPPPTWQTPPPAGWGPPPPPGAWSAGYGAPPVAGPTANQMSLVSMILGIGGLAASPCCSFLVFPIGVGAVATGIIGLTQVRADLRQTGKGQAVAGIVCGALAMVLPILFIALSFGFSSFSSYE